MNSIPSIRPSFIMVLGALFLAVILCPVGIVSGEGVSDASSPDGLTFVHPGIAHSRAELDFVRERIEAGDQPWADAWAAMLESDYADPEWTPSPYAHVERGAYNRPDVGSSGFMSDGTAAYTQALLWTLTDDPRHAEKAREIIKAWSETLESISNHDARLLVGMTGHQYCNAAELLRHEWDGWPEAEQEGFRKMLRDVWYPVIEDFYPSANGNWDAAMIQTMMAMGVFLDDEPMFRRAVDYFLDGEGNGRITHYFNEFGECQESGRDQAHTQMGLEYLSNSCETAWKQGVDLYSTADDRLSLGFEYTAQYNAGHEVRYVPYRSFEGRYYNETISDKSRGRFRPMYERVFNHYHNRQGLEMPFTWEAVQQTRPEGGGISSLPWGTLMFADQPEDLVPLGTFSP